MHQPFHSGNIHNEFSKTVNYSKKCFVISYVIRLSVFIKISCDNSHIVFYYRVYFKKCSYFRNKRYQNWILKKPISIVLEFVTYLVCLR